MTFTVEVTGLSPKTKTHSLREFFAFCGNISAIEHKLGSTKACITFEKASAAKTALMLQGGTLDGAKLQVTSDQVLPDEPEGEGADIEQSDKPRAAIAAEYLAKGYVLSDQIVQRAIQLDQEKGISKKFREYIEVLYANMTSLDKQLGEKLGGPEPASARLSANIASLDKQLGERLGGGPEAEPASAKISASVGAAYTGARERASSIDEERGISKQAGEYYNKAITHEYYVNAINSRFSNSVYDFYTTTTKQISDVHEEAKRIAEQQKADAAPAPAPVPAS
jgi:hypothetical protein